MLAKFLGNLEAGNVGNAGVQITKFAIKRRKPTELTPITLGYVAHTSSHSVTFTDYTQAIGDYIYSIVPVGENGLEGSPNTIAHSSIFTGWWLVDKQNSIVLAFDKFIGSEPNVDIQLNQSRVVVETFSKFPTLFYQESEFRTFSLSTIFIPESEYETVDELYESFLNNFIRPHKPILIKSSSGGLYVCDLSNPRDSSPLNHWRSRSYLQTTIDCTEISDYESYMIDI